MAGAVKSAAQSAWCMAGGVIALSLVCELIVIVVVVELQGAGLVGCGGAQENVNECEVTLTLLGRLGMILVSIYL